MLPVDPLLNDKASPVPIMTAYKVQKRAKKPSNRGKVDRPNYGGRAPVDTHSPFPQASSEAANKRAILVAEKAYQKKEKDRADRLKKHEVVDATQYPASPFVVLRVPSHRLESLGYPAAEKLWGAHARPLGLPRDWVKRNQDIVSSHTVVEDIGVSTDRLNKSQDNNDKRTNHERLRTAAQQEDTTFTNLLASPPLLSESHALPNIGQNTIAVCNPTFSHNHSSASLPVRDQVPLSANQQDQLELLQASPPGHKSVQPTFEANHICNSEHILPINPTRREDDSRPPLSNHILGTLCQQGVRQSIDTEQDDPRTDLTSVEKTSHIVKFKVPDGFKVNEDMAPVRDPQSVHGSLKEVVQNLFEVQTQVHGFVNDTQPLLIDKMTELAHSLGHLQDLTSATKSPNNPIHQTRIAPEIIDYVDDGRNPDIFTRDFVELVSRGNAVINGKQQAFRDFSQVFADALKDGIDGIDKEVDLVMKNAEAKKDATANVETQGNGTVRS